MAGKRHSVLYCIRLVTEWQVHVRNLLKSLLKNQFFLVRIRQKIKDQAKQKNRYGSR